MRHNMVIIDMISIMMTIIWDYEAQGLHFLKCFHFLTPHTPPTQLRSLIVISIRQILIYEKSYAHLNDFEFSKKFLIFYMENISILKSQHESYKLCCMYDRKSSNWNKQWLFLLFVSLSTLFFTTFCVLKKTFFSCSCYCWEYKTHMAPPLYIPHIRVNWHIRVLFFLMRTNFLIVMLCNHFFYSLKKITKIYSYRRVQKKA